MTSIKESLRWKRFWKANTRYIELNGHDISKFTVGPVKIINERGEVEIHSLRLHRKEGSL